MATFVKGDWVEIIPRPDFGWEQWSLENSNLCGKTAKIVKITEGDWVNEIYIEVEYRGKRIWFRDNHLIKVDNYEEIFSEAIHEAAHQLNETERISKKLRDEILTDVFGDDTLELERFGEEDTQPIPDELFDDWEAVTTEEIIPLPGDGGTMTTPKDPDSNDPKAMADQKRKKVRKIKTFSKKKKIIKKKKTSSSLIDSWTLSEEEIKDLENYLDSISDIGKPNTAGPYDYEYFDSD